MNSTGSLRILNNGKIITNDGMKRYEGLFILNTAGKEDTIKEMIDSVSAEIESAGGKIETVQKMEKRSFARVADKKYQAGYYMNVIFEIQSDALVSLNSRFGANVDIFRVLLSNASATPAVAEVTASRDATAPSGR